MPASTPISFSYWEKQSYFEGFSVAVIGSGIVGLSAAIRIKALMPELEVLVLERGSLPSGASTKNAGFACFGSMTELLDDLAGQDEGQVWELVKQRFKGLQHLRATLGDQAIGYEPLGGYELFKPGDEQVYEACLGAMPAFNRILKDITGDAETFRPSDQHLPAFRFGHTRHLMLNAAEGQLHTGKMMRALTALARSKGVEILNGIEVTAVQTGKTGAYIECNPGGNLFVQQVLLATNGMARRLAPDLDVRPARNQVLITEQVPGLSWSGSFHYDRGYYYFRNIDGRILLGGGRHLAPEEEATDVFGHTERVQSALMSLLEEVILPGQSVQVAQWWSGILGLGLKKKPIIKRISPHVSVAVRLGGMGVAIGMLVGEQAAEVLLEPLG